MKKALLSLLMVAVCLPFAFGQASDNPTFETESVTSCVAYQWINGVTYTHDTVATYTTESTIYVLHLTILPTYYDTVNVIEVAGACSAVWNNKEYTETGYYLDTLTASNTCDSIVKLNISLASVDSIQTVTRCDNYTAPWGEIYTESTVIDTNISDGDCTYHTVITLTINNSYIGETEVVEAGCSYVWRNDTITDLLVHSDTLQTAGGCDSILSIQVSSFSGDTYDTVEVVACDKYGYAENDTLTASGFRTVDSVAGECTFHHVTKITIVNSVRDTNVVEGLGGCTISWNGNVYNHDYNDSTVYAMLHTTLGNCDSLAAMHINLSMVDQDTTHVRHCGIRYFGWQYAPTDTMTVDTNFVVSDTNQTTQCITNHVLALTFVDSAAYDVANSCGPYTYLYNSHDGIGGHKDTAYFEIGGVYTENQNGEPMYSTLRNSINLGCKVYRTLTLNLKDPEQRMRPDTAYATACDKYVFRVGNKKDTFYTSIDTTLTYSSRSYSFCYDSTASLKLTIKNSTYTNTEVTVCDTFLWSFNDAIYTTSTTDSVKLNVRNAVGCDSIGKLILTVNYSPVVTIEGRTGLNPGETTTTLEAVSDDQIASYAWYKNDETTPFSTSATVELSGITSNTDIRLHSTTPQNCSSDNWITISTNVGIDNAEAMQVNIFPNPTSRFLNIESAAGISEVEIYNAVGQKVIAKSVNAANTQLDLGALGTGNYSMRIVALDGSSTTGKFIVNK